jgi:hypothetical protein
MKTVQRSLFLIIPVVSAFLLSGCTAVNTAINFTENFEGYPCDGKCDQFQSGFETAMTRQYTQNDDCQSLSEDEKIGCLSYMHEYRLANNQPAGYLFP